MVNIYSYLNHVFLDIKQESRNNPPFAFVILLLLTIPLPYIFSSIALGLLVFTTFFKFRLRYFRLKSDLLFPIALYLLMLLSLIWSIDKPFTFEALSKELPLLAIPICFLAFPAFTTNQRYQILKFFSFGMLLYCAFYLFRAAIRFALTGSKDHFFYHGLVTEDLNAIHVSVFFAVACIWFYANLRRSRFNLLASAVLFAAIILLSSKNIIVVLFLIFCFYHLFTAKLSIAMKLLSVAAILALLSAILWVSPVSSRFKTEFDTLLGKTKIAKEQQGSVPKVYHVTIREAWNNPVFSPNDYFSGSAFRVYQFRIFTEMLHEDNIFFTGYGLNASYPKIEEKAIQYVLYMGNDQQFGYQKNNFHSQYIQNFAELGIFGLILLLAMLVITVKKAISAKDFVHISFAILMISLFLTESFLWRQRGVMFFTAMYCLFNSGITLTAPEKTKGQL